MIDVPCLAARITVITGIVALLPVLYCATRYFNKYIEKRKLKRNNIYIFIAYRENDSKDEKIALAVYNHKNQHFNFEISKDEYLNVLDKSNGRIKNYPFC